MTSFRIRPRFKFETNYSCDEIMERIEQKLAGEDYPFYATISKHHIFLKIAREELHYWSPQLDLSCEEKEGGGTLIRGLYGPSPHVWTFFMFSYLAIGTIATFIALIGLSRLSLDMPAGILWVLPGLGGLALLLYISSQMGQKIGAEQTFMLHHFLEEVLEERVHVH
jgi:hypothetical protein